jgi:hypothetical protein
MKWIGRTSLLLTAGSALALGLTFWLVEGGAAGHAREHLTGAIVAGLVAMFVGFSEHTLGAARIVARAGIGLGFVYVAATQLGEGISAYGYDATNTGERADLLVDAHGVFDGLATTSIIALGAAVVAWALVVLWQRGTRAAAVTH